MKRIRLMIVLCLIFHIVNGQRKDAVIRLRFKQPMNDTIIFRYQQHFMFKDIYGITFTYGRPVNGEVEFRVDGSRLPGYFSLNRHRSGKRAVALLEGEDSHHAWFTEAGDSIVVDFDDDRAVACSGRGSAKGNFYIALAGIDKTFNDPDLPMVINTVKDSLAYLSYAYSPAMYRRYDRWVDSIYGREKEVLKRYRTEMSPFAATVLGINLQENWKYFALQTNRNMLSYSSIASPQNRRYAFERFFSHYHFDDFGNIDTSDALARFYSAAYVDNVTLRLMAYYQYKALGFDLKRIMDDQRELFSKDAYNYVVRNFRDSLRDKLLVNLLLRNKERDTSLFFYNQAIQYCGSPFFQGLLQGLAASHQGEPFAPFHLTTLDGKPFSNADLKGKVTLFDFWYTGCVGCLQVIKVLKPKIRELKQRYPDFQTVSVCIDIDEQRWRESAASGKYSFPGSVMVRTVSDGPAKFEHPLIKAYQISAYPRLMLVDKSGKIVYANIPYSRTDLVEKAVKGNL